MNKWTSRVVTSTPIPTDVVFLGQEELRAKVSRFLDDRPFPHTLLVGMPGMGKTNFARYVAQQKKMTFTELYAPVMPSAIPAIGLCLLDEAHLQRRPENLFPMMEEPHGLMTLVAATSKPEKMDDAWRSRFTLRLKLGDYSKSDMFEIAQHLLPEASEDALTAYASASGGNPRHLNKILQVADAIDPENIGAVLATVETTIDGLTEIHLDYLRCLSNVGRPVGLTQLAALTYSGEDELRAAERLLMKLQLIDLTPSGRTITRTGASFIREFDES